MLNRICRLSRIRYIQPPNRYKMCFLKNSWYCNNNTWFRIQLSRHRNRYRILNRWYRYRSNIVYSLRHRLFCQRQHLYMLEKN